jgi:hypothetical protein
LRWQGDCCELFGVEVVEEILHPAIIPAERLEDRRMTVVANWRCGDRLIARALGGIMKFIKTLI